MSVRAQGVFSRNAINAFALLTAIDGDGTLVEQSDVTATMIPLLQDGDPFEGKTVGPEGAKLRRVRIKALSSMGTAYIVRIFHTINGTPKLLEQFVRPSTALAPSATVGIDISDWYELDVNLTPNSTLYCTLSINAKRVLVEAELLDMNNEALPTTGSGS